MISRSGSKLLISKAKKAKAGWPFRHPALVPVESVSRILWFFKFPQRTGSHFSNPPEGEFRFRVATSPMRLQPGSVSLTRDGRITRSPCSALHHPWFVIPFGCPKGGGLLPRLFTLTQLAPGGIFSVTLSVNPDLRRDCPQLSRGGLSCGVRTFLPQTS